MKTPILVLTAFLILGGCAGSNPKYAHTTAGERTRANATCEIIMRWEYPPSYKERLGMRQQCFDNELGVPGSRSLVEMRKEVLDTWYTNSNGDVVVAPTVRRTDPVAATAALLVLGAAAGAVHHANRPHKVRVHVPPPRPPRSHR